MSRLVPLCRKTQECRDWINGELSQPLNTEHVRILLAWIDSTKPIAHNNKKAF